MLFSCGCLICQGKVAWNYFVINLRMWLHMCLIFTWKVMSFFVLWADQLTNHPLLLSVWCFRDNRPPTQSTLSGSRASEAVPRWVPPSVLRRDAGSPNERHDYIFRRVRGWDTQTEWWWWDLIIVSQIYFLWLAFISYATAKNCSLTEWSVSN